MYSLSESRATMFCPDSKRLHIISFNKYDLPCPEFPRIIILEFVLSSVLLLKSTMMFDPYLSLPR